MEKAGFKVDLQAMDWQTLVTRRTKKDPPNAGGWSAFLTSWASVDMLDPVAAVFLNASCDKATFGWPCDAEMEKLRDAFAKETDPAKQKAIAEAVQLRVLRLSDAYPARPVRSAARRSARTSTGVARRRRSARVLEHRGEDRAMLGYILRRLLATLAGDADRRGVRVPDAAPDAGRSGRDHRGRQRQLPSRSPRSATASGSTSRSSRSSSSGSATSCAATSASRSSSRRPSPS